MSMLSNIRITEDMDAFDQDLCELQDHTSQRDQKSGIFVECMYVSKLESTLPVCWLTDLAMTMHVLLER